jgi:hypothetical protein
MTELNRLRNVPESERHVVNMNRGVTGSAVTSGPSELVDAHLLRRPGNGRARGLREASGVV